MRTFVRVRTESVWFSKIDLLSMLSLSAIKCGWCRESSDPFHRQTHRPLIVGLKKGGIKMCKKSTCPTMWSKLKMFYYHLTISLAFISIIAMPDLFCCIPPNYYMKFQKHQYFNYTLNPYFTHQQLIWRENGKSAARQRLFTICYQSDNLKIALSKQRSASHCMIKMWKGLCYSIILTFN